MVILPCTAAHLLPLLDSNRFHLRSSRVTNCADIDAEAMQKRQILLKHLKGAVVYISKRASSKDSCGCQFLANLKFGKGAASHGTSLLQFLSLDGYCMPFAALMLAPVRREHTVLGNNAVHRDEFRTPTTPISES